MCIRDSDPTSGANPLITCSDGAFSNAVSTNLSYTNGPLYMTAAYEFHQNVNRSSDIAGMYSLTPAVPPPEPNCASIGAAGFPLGQQLCNDDVANEDAMKLGIMYTFPT